MRPDLTFKMVVFGSAEWRWDLRILLYVGGAKADLKKVDELIARGELGEPQEERIELVVKLHEVIQAGLSSGGRRTTADNAVYHVRQLFNFAELNGRRLSLDAITETYCAWADFLFHRTLIKSKQRPAKLEHRPLKASSAYISGTAMGTVLDRVLDRNSRIIELTRLRHPSHRKTATGVQSEKQSLADTFAFGHVLQDICDALTLEVTRETSMPIRIPLRNGKEIIRIGNIDIGAGPVLDECDVEQAKVLGNRFSLANLRMEAELLMLIGQTGLNRSQAANLELRHFFYVSHLDGYQVKDQKARRGGTVLFEIYRDYKPHFERYLAWRRELFPKSTRLFPFVRLKGTRPDRAFDAERLRNICKKLQMPFVSPSRLRSTRVNWLLRKSADPELTAEMAQHMKETLLNVYARPSLQRAMVESARFWAHVEPSIERMLAVGPGGCTGRAESAPDIPRGVAKPDCTRASGCLWCESHRDFDSLDYVWSLASFRHLKVIELSRVAIPASKQGTSPAQHSIERLTAKLKWFYQSNDARREWVDEAMARMEEGEHHPDWKDEIVELEGAW